jgi:NTP pyrophosphatase (non-canonical NTP hydrolase)
MYTPPFDAEFVEVLAEVAGERVRQDQKFGRSSKRPVPPLYVLAEEFGEVARAMCEHDVPNLREELIQVAAVAVAMVEGIDRGDVPS